MQLIDDIAKLVDTHYGSNIVGILVNRRKEKWTTLRYRPYFIFLALCQKHEIPLTHIDNALGLSKSVTCCNMRNIYGKYMHYPDFFADFDYLFNKSIGKPYDKGLTHYLSSKRYETLARLIKEYDNRFFYLKAYNVANPIRTYGLNTRQLWFFNAFIKRYMLTLRNKSSLIGLTNVAYWKVLKGADYSREYSIIEPLLLEKIEDIYADFYYRE